MPALYTVLALGLALNFKMLMISVYNIVKLCWTQVYVCC